MASASNDPDLALKRSARRRLVGALVLVVATVVILPLVFDSKPKPVSRDLAIHMPEGDAAGRATPSAPAAMPAKAEAKADAKTDVKSDAVAESKSEAKSESKSEPKAVVKADDKPEAKAAAKASDAKTAEAKPADGKGAAKAEAKADTKAHADAKPKSNPSSALDKGEEVVRAKEPATAKRGGMLIQIGAFANEDRARNWLSKLKASKLPAYVEHKTTEKGERYLLRVGPLVDRDAVDTAERKIRALGLTGRLIEEAQ